MQITKLELTGFKSFVEPTELAIAPGLTGVIGPNGCGKSNLLEALRWVMGETSVKSMRGGAMDDVIFAGTDHRPARNHASVSLTLERDPALALPRALSFVTDGFDGAASDAGDQTAAQSSPRTADQAQLGSAAAEFVISRKITRGDGSAYGINGRDVRARDVRLLFEDAATGARSHALVRQGQIGEIIRAKPEQRRRILEDAAGIAGLHARRHEAELKLKATSANIERVQDVADQLETQRNALQRQARQARKYRELAESITAHEAFALHLDWLVVGLTLAAREQDLRQVLTTLAGLEAELSAAERDAQVRRDALGPARDAEMTRAAVHQRLAIEVESTGREIEQVGRRQAAMRQQRKTLADDLAREAERSALARDTAERCASDLTETRQLLANHDAALHGAQAKSSAARDHAAKAQQAAQAAGHGLAQVQAQAASLRAQIANADSSARQAHERMVQYEASVSQSHAAVAAAKATRKDAARAQADADTRAEAARAAADTAHSAYGAARAAAAAADDDAQQAVRALDKLELEISTLAKLTGAPSAAGTGGAQDARQHHGRKHRKGAHKTGAAPNAASGPAGPTVLDLITVRPGFERAVAGALRGALRAPVRCVSAEANLALASDEKHVWVLDTDPTDFAQACSAHQSAAQTHVWPTLEWPTDTSNFTQADRSPTGQPVAPRATLSDAINAPEPLMGALRAALERCCPVAAPPTRQDLTALPNDWALVGSDGTVWRATGYIETDAESTADAARLSERNRLLELRKQVPERRAAADAARARHEQLRAAFTASETALNDARRAKEEATREAHACGQAVERAATAITSAEREQALLDRQLSDARTLLTAQTTQRDEAAAKLAALPATAGLETDLAALQAAARQALEAQASADAALQTVQSQAATLRATATRLEKDAANAAAQERAASGHRKTLEGRAAKLDADLERIAALPQELAEKLAK
ncbi:MAG: AAA family ATPase, partial [Pseudomonadota bacterium]